MRILEVNLLKLHCLFPFRFTSCTAPHKPGTFNDPKRYKLVMPLAAFAPYTPDFSSRIPRHSGVPIRGYRGRRGSGVDDI